MDGVSIFNTYNIVALDSQFLLQAVTNILFPGSPVSSTNKADHHDITEILLKVTLNLHHNPNKILFRSFIGSAGIFACSP